MEVRYLMPDDAGEWLRLRVEALQGDPAAFSASLEEYQSLSIDEVKKRLWSGGDAFVVGAFEAHRMVGMAGFFREKGPKSWHKGRVWGVYVTPSERGSGVGRRMMQMLLERGMAINGVEQVLLSVAANQEAAIRLYRSLGFQPFGREPRALRVGDRYIDEEYMILRKTKVKKPHFPANDAREMRHSKGSKKGKAPLTFQSRTPRQPSPRTAKPRMDSRGGAILCKRHFGNPNSGKLSGGTPAVMGSGESRLFWRARAARLKPCPDTNLHFFRSLFSRGATGTVRDGLQPRCRPRRRALHREGR